MCQAHTGTELIYMVPFLEAKEGLSLFQETMHFYFIFQCLIKLSAWVCNSLQLKLFYGEVVIILA
jgi:hypothetical protein